LARRDDEMLAIQFLTILFRGLAKELEKARNIVQTRVTHSVGPPMTDEKHKPKKKKEKVGKKAKKVRLSLLIDL